MPKFIKSKFGILLGGIYILVIIFAVVEYLRTPPEVMKEFALLILTAPFSFLLALLFDAMGLMNGNDLMVFPLLTFGAIVNVLILCFIGSLFSDLVDYLSSRKRD